MPPVYRYPGVRPFEKADSGLFFGRDRDIELLYNLIRTEQVVTLFSRSGYGKSSLINAGIIPRMLEESPEESNFQFISVRFGNYLPGKSQSPLEKILHSVQKTCPNTDPDSQFLDHLCNPANLWYQCKRRKWFNSRQLLFLFDQFEEFFTYPEEQQQTMKTELAELLYVQIPQFLRKLLPLNSGKKIPDQAAYLNKRLDVKVLFSIRSDRIHFLDSLKDAIPNILYKRYELRSLTREQAMQAIQYPAQLDFVKMGQTARSTFASPSFMYTKEAVDSIINYLDDHGGKAKESIETFELQLICRQVEEGIIKKQTKGDVIGLSRAVVNQYDLPNLKKVFKNYYDQQIRQLEKKDRGVAKLIIEEGLLSEGDTPDSLRRLSIDELALLQKYQKKGANRTLLNRLENGFLIRREPNNTEGYNIEISHDTLMLPISDARKRRRLYSNMREMARMVVRGPGLIFIIAIIIFFTGIGGGVGVYSYQAIEGDQNTVPDYNNSQANILSRNRGTESAALTEKTLISADKIERHIDYIQDFVSARSYVLANTVYNLCDKWLEDSSSLEINDLERSLLKEKLEVLKPEIDDLSNGK